MPSAPASATSPTSRRRGSSSRTSPRSSPTPKLFRAGHRRASSRAGRASGSTRWSASSRAASSSPRRSPTRSAPGSPSSASPASSPGRSSARPTRSSTARPTLELHVDAVGPGERVLVVDDVLATGGTAEAVGRLVARQGAELVAYSFLVELVVPARRAAARAEEGARACSRTDGACRPAPAAAALHSARGRGRTRLKFLGTAGARFVVSTQLRHSGGLVWTLARRARSGWTRARARSCAPSPRARSVDPARTDVLVVTHRHLDHSGDATAVVEAMSAGRLRAARDAARAARRARGGAGGATATRRPFVARRAVLADGRPPRARARASCSRRRSPTTTASRPTATGSPRPGSPPAHVVDTYWMDALAEAYAGVDLLVVNTTRAEGARPPLPAPRRRRRGAPRRRDPPAARGPDAPRHAAAPRRAGAGRARHLGADRRPDGRRARRLAPRARPISPARRAGARVVPARRERRRDRVERGVPTRSSPPAPRSPPGRCASRSACAPGARSSRSPDAARGAPPRRSSVVVPCRDEARGVERGDALAPRAGPARARDGRGGRPLDRRDRRHPRPARRAESRASRSSTSRRSPTGWLGKNHACARGRAPRAAAPGCSSPTRDVRLRARRAPPRARRRGARAGLGHLAVAAALRRARASLERAFVTGVRGAPRAARPHPGPAAAPGRAPTSGWAPSTSSGATPTSARAATPASPSRWWTT